MVVRASAEESRRAVLGGFLAAGAALVAGSANAAGTPIELLDDRKAKQSGFDIIYEARELTLPQGVRDGMTQVRREEGGGGEMGRVRRRALAAADGGHFAARGKCISAASPPGAQDPGAGKGRRVWNELRGAMGAPPRRRGTPARGLRPAATLRADQRASC